MKKVSKRIALITAALLCISMGVNVNAGERDELNIDSVKIISPRYKIIDRIGSGLTIDTSRGASVYVECETSISAKIAIKSELQQYSNNRWVTINTWNNSESSSTACVIDEYYYVTRNHDYRVKSSITVTSGSITETETVYSSVEECWSIQQK